MKLAFQPTTKVLGLAFVFVLLLIGCGDLATTKVAPMQKQAVSIPVFVTDSSGNPIDSAALKTYGDTVDASGEESHEAVSQKGHALFYANAQSNQQIRITASREGFLDTGAEVNASSAGEYPVRIVMIRTQDESLSGVSSEKQTFANSIGEDGTTLNEITLSAENASITIPAGSVLKTQDDAPAAAGDLSVLLTSFDATTAQAFPGSFNVVAGNVPDGNGTASDRDVSMMTAGYTAIILEDAAGNRIKYGTFAITIDVTMSLNPETGNPVVPGDTIAVWSYDETTGRWSYEDKGVVTQNGEKLQVTVTAHHLSYYNLAYQDGDYCDINISFPAGAGYVTYWMFALDEGWSNTANDYLREGSLELVNAPANRTVYVEVSYLGQTILTTFMDFNDSDHDQVCTPLEVDLSGLFEGMVPTILTFTEQCPTGLNFGPVPNVELYQTYPTSYLGISDANGEINVSLPDSQSIDLDYFLSLGLNNPRYVGVLVDGGGNNYMQDTISVVGGTDQTINFTLAEEYCLPPTTGTGSTN